MCINNNNLRTTVIPGITALILIIRFYQLKFRYSAEPTRALITGRRRAGAYAIHDAHVFSFIIAYKYIRNRIINYYSQAW